MEKRFKFSRIVMMVIVLGCLFASCSKEEEVRTPDAILGIWSPSENLYMTFTDNYTVLNLEVTEEDGYKIGLTSTDAYFYEPGYQIVIYMMGTHATVFQIVKLTQSELVWCPVDEITFDQAQEADEIGQLIGDIIKKAQEGYDLDPELYESLRSVSESEYRQMEDSLDYIF